MDKIKDLYDLIIIGAGPAGLAAALYACRANLKVLLIEKTCIGGQIILTDRVDNYPGFPESISGCELADRMSRQAERFGLIRQDKDIIGFQEDEGIYNVLTADKLRLKALSVIIATGASWKKLGVEGEEEFSGKGVSYCATCDGPFYKNKSVVVVGGGNAAVEEAIFLTRFVDKLTLVHRRGQLRAAKVLQDELMKTKKVDLCLESVVLKISGEKTVKSIEVKSVNSDQTKTIQGEGVFIFIGHKPNTDPFKDILKTDGDGYILTAADMETSTQGVFAAGDVRSKTLRQVITAASDGACAAFSAERYIRKLKNEEYK